VVAGAAGLGDDLVAAGQWGQMWWLAAGDL